MTAPNARRLVDQVAVVTGGASGIGRACAERFVAEGATVVLGDINLGQAVSSAAAIEAAGGTALAVELDAASVDSNTNLFQTAVDKYGRLDIVVAAAGLSHAGYVSGELAEKAAPTLIDQTLEDWQRLMSVNLDGVMLADQHAARAMIESGNGGSIINIASAAAKVPLYGAVDYCVSKAGVWMLTKAFALEMAEHGIRVNAIGPGFIETPMTARMSATDEGRQAMISRTPMGRLGEPEEIASTAAYLASADASYVTGQILFPAGGLFVG